MLYSLLLASKGHKGQAISDLLQFEILVIFKYGNSHAY
jgi:hypothetical protein